MFRAANPWRPRVFHEAGLRMDSGVVPDVVAKPAKRLGAPAGKLTALPLTTGSAPSPPVGKPTPVHHRGAGAERTIAAVPPPARDDERPAAALATSAAWARPVGSAGARTRGQGRRH